MHCNVINEYHLPLMKLFTVKHFLLIKLFTANNNFLPLIKLFTVNDDNLPLIKNVMVNKIINR